MVADLLKQPRTLAVRFELSPLAPTVLRLVATQSALALASIATAATAGSTTDPASDQAVVRSRRAPSIMRSLAPSMNYAFTDEVLNYLEAREPLLAALLCLLNSPVATVRQGQYHLNVALQLSKVRAGLGAVASPSVLNR